MESKIVMGEQNAYDLLKSLTDESAQLTAEEGDKAAFGEHSIFCEEGCGHPKTGQK